MNYQIKNRYTNAVLFECELTEDQASGNAARHALEKATAAKANLRGANLRGANLRGANLRGANLRGANLYGADLRGADLRGAELYGAELGGANLRGANLRGANLRGANLRGAELRGADLYGADLRGADLRGAELYGAELGGANLRGAELGGAELGGAELGGAELGGAELGEGLKLVGNRPVLTIGPIGSRSDTMFAFLTESGIRIRTGCFFGTVDEFSQALADEHGENEHSREYTAALELIKVHAEIWAPVPAAPTASNDFPLGQACDLSGEGTCESCQ